MHPLNGDCIDLKLRRKGKIKLINRFGFQIITEDG